MKTQLNRKIACSKGFSLLEMLVVVTIIGIVAAIALPNIGSFSATANTATAKRNAQSIASTFANGSVAGVTWTGNTKAQKIQSIVSGGTAPSGMSFGVGGLDNTAINRASVYLDDNLRFVISGGQTATSL